MLAASRIQRVRIRGQGDTKGKDRGRTEEGQGQGRTEGRTLDSYKGGHSGDNVVD